MKGNKKVPMAEKVNVIENGLNSKIMEFILRAGKPQRWADIHAGVGEPNGITGTAVHKALKRLTDRKFLVRLDNDGYYISKAFAESVRDTYTLLNAAGFW